MTNELKNFEPRRRSTTFVRDVIAGLTVAVVELPQSMAYALIAGVPPVYGLYTSVIQGVIGAALSGNPHVRTGPTNTQSLLVASALAHVGGVSAGQYLALVATLTAMKGLLQLIAAAMRAGVLFRYVSPSTVVGISGGAGVLILAGQLPGLLGVGLGAPSNWPGVIGTIDRLARTPDAIDPRAAGIAAFTIVAMLALPRLGRFVPAALIAVGGSTLAVWLLDWRTLGVVGEIPRALPDLAWPLVAGASYAALAPAAGALAILGMIETVAIARTLGGGVVARASNRELYAQGVANLASSACGAIPGSASFSRSLLDRAAGAASRMSGVYNAAFVAAFAYAFAPAGAVLPLATLGGVLVVIAFKLIDWRFVVRVARTHRADFAVCLASFLATVLLPLQYGVFVGIGLNLLLQLRVASRLRAVELDALPGGGYREMPEDARGDGPLRILQVDGNLFFALRDELADRLDELATSPARVVIVRLRNTHSVDVSVLDCVAAFVARVERSGRHVLLCGVRPELARMLRAHATLGPRIGIDAPLVIAGGETLLASLNAAVARARELGAPPRAVGDEPSWVYVI